MKKNREKKEKKAKKQTVGKNTAKKQTYGTKRKKREAGGKKGKTEKKKRKQRNGKYTDETFYRKPYVFFSQIQVQIF